MDAQDRQARETPAADAAGLLLRIGFALLVVAAPFAAIFSRRAFVILVPVGALLIVISALIDVPRETVIRLRDAATGTAGLFALAYALWMLFSLVWTPFPGPAAERSLRVLGNVALACAVAAALPQRMRSSNLHLMSIGAVIATAALAVTAILGPGIFGFLSHQEAPTLGRAAIAISAMVWPAVAWTLTRGRDQQGMALIAACGIAIAATGSMDAAIVLITALLVFLAARINVGRAAHALGLLAGGVVMAAPALAIVGRMVSQATDLASTHALNAIGLWQLHIAERPLRLITGHGFDTLYRARAVGLVEPTALPGLIAEVWYDLGIIGAATLAALLYYGFRSMARLSPHVGASALAVVAAILVFMIIDPTATQAWWLSVCVVVSVMMVAVNNGQHRTVRPVATIAHTRLRV